MKIKNKIPTAKPFFGNIQRILKDFNKILNSRRLMLGPYGREFEKKFANYVGTKYSITTSSCTSALEISLRYINVKNKEVIVPANTFIACPNSVIFAGGKPVFAETKSDSFCLDLQDVQKKITSNTKAVMVVHLSGLPMPELKALSNLCRKNKITLIEDCSHAHGARIKGKSVGSWGDIGCFSFFPTKNMTTGFGGAITTNDKKLWEFAKSTRLHGQDQQLDKGIELGNDWMMSEFSAVLGLYQLEDLNKNIKKRNQIAKKYMKGLDKIEGISYSPVPSDIYHAYYKFLAILDKKINKEEFLQGMREKNIEVATLYPRPCYAHPIYKKLKYGGGRCKATEEAISHQISLPVFVEMTNKEIEYVLEHITKEIKKQKCL